MFHHLRYLTYLLSISVLSNGLPLENPARAHDIVPRAKSYLIVNVDGGSTAPPEPEATTIVEKTTETIKITSTAPAKTNTVTAIIVEPNPAPAPTSTSKASTSSIETTLTSSLATPALPSVVTIIVTQTAGPTEYYDNGLWHTYYPVKTFATVAISSAAIPLETVAPYA